MGKQVNTILKWTDIHADKSYIIIFFMNLRLSHVLNIEYINNNSYYSFKMKKEIMKQLILN